MRATEVSRLSGVCWIGGGSSLLLLLQAATSSVASTTERDRLRFMGFTA